MNENIRFTKEHEWIVIKEGIAVIGISDFAQSQLGDIVSIELPKVGSIFRRMQTMAIIYCVMSGEIVEVNEELLEHPEWINQSPYELGWIVKLKPSNMEEFHNLMTNEQYNKFIGETEENREKDQSGG